jgi:hypothetical protein
MAMMLHMEGIIARPRRRVQLREIEFDVIEEEAAVCRFEQDAVVPEWVTRGGLYSITRTRDELSIVCHASSVPTGVRCESPWRALKVRGPISFDEVGIAAAFTSPLATAGISVFVISTFDTDYLLVRSADFGRAVAALRSSGHIINETGNSSQ